MYEIELQRVVSASAMTIKKLARAWLRRKGRRCASQDVAYTVKPQNSDQTVSHKVPSFAWKEVLALAFIALNVPKDDKVRHRETSRMVEEMKDKDIKLELSEEYSFQKSILNESNHSTSTTSALDVAITTEDTSQKEALISAA